MKFSLIAIILLFFCSCSVRASDFCVKDSVPKSKFDSINSELKDQKDITKKLLKQIDELDAGKELLKLDSRNQVHKIDSLEKIMECMQKKLNSNENIKIDTLQNRNSNLESRNLAAENLLKSTKFENESLKKIIESLKQDSIKISDQRFADGKMELCRQIKRYYSENSFDVLLKDSNRLSISRDKDILSENNFGVIELDKILSYIDFVEKVKKSCLKTDILLLAETCQTFGVNSEIVKFQLEYLNNYSKILNQFSEALIKLELLASELRTTETQIKNQKSQMIYLICRLDYDWEISSSDFEILKSDMRILIEDINKNPKIDVQPYRIKYRL